MAAALPGSVRRIPRPIDRADRGRRTNRTWAAPRSVATSVPAPRRDVSTKSGGLGEKFRVGAEKLRLLDRSESGDTGLGEGVDLIRCGLDRPLVADPREA